MLEGRGSQARPNLCRARGMGLQAHQGGLGFHFEAEGCTGQGPKPRPALGWAGLPRPARPGRAMDGLLVGAIQSGRGWWKVGQLRGLFSWLIQLVNSKVTVLLWANN